MKLGDVLEKIVGGGTPSKNRSEFWNGNIPWASVKDINEGQVFLSSTEDTITEEGVKNSSTNIIYKGNVILPTRMGLGRCVINTIDTAINQDLKALYPKKDKLDSKFLLYWLKNNSRLIESMGSGTTVKGIRIEQLTDMNFKELDLYIQQRIAKVLSNYDNLIENNNKRIKILEEMAQKIYKEWFVDFNYPGHETATFKDTELGKIPSDWKATKIGSEFETVLGGTPSRNNPEYWGEKIPWLSSGKTNELRIITESEFITELGLKKSSTKLMPKYTTLLAITGATLGQVSMIGTEMCANQSVVGIINDKYQEYIFYMIKNNISDLVLKASGGAQQHINKDIVNDMLFILPSKNILQKFEDIAKPLNDEIFSLLYTNATLKQTRDLLLSRLMSGEIDVENLEVV